MGEQTEDDTSSANNYYVKETVLLLLSLSFQIGLHDIIETYVYPIGLAVSIMCLVATFLLYSFLPQLRDLTGKFILGICAFLATTLSLLLVQIFGRRDINVDQLTTGNNDFCSHVSVYSITQYHFRNEPSFQCGWNVVVSHLHGASCLEDHHEQVSLHQSHRWH